MTPVIRYQVNEPVAGELHDAFLGPIPYSFTSGTHTPTSEGEELVFERLLVPSGAATRVDVDLDDLNVAELRALAEVAGVDHAGLKKADLVEALSAPAPTDPADEPDDTEE